MGGRGSSGTGANGVFGKDKPITVETRYTEARGWQRGRYTDTVLQAVSTGGGKVELVYATADEYKKTAKTNRTNYVTYTLDHGFVNNSPHNINFDNITEFSGQTYAVKETLKKKGFIYRDGKWVKK